MDWDSTGNLYFTTGDNTGNNPNGTDGGYTNSDRAVHDPVPRRRERCPRCAHAAVAPTDPGGRRCGTSASPTPDRHRATPTSTKASCCGSSRSPIRATRRASARRTRSRAPMRRTAPNLFPPDSQAVLDGKAKPEVFAMGVRNLTTRSTSIPRPTRSRPRGSAPTRAPNSTTWGPAKTENAAIRQRPATTAGRTARPVTGSTTGPSCPATTGGGIAANLVRQRARNGRRRRRRPDRRLLGLQPGKPSRTTRRTTRASRTSRRRSRRTSGTARRAVATTTRATPTACRSHTDSNTGTAPDTFRRARSPSVAARPR